MAKAKLGFTILSIPNKVLKARNTVTLMTGNASYPTPNPTLATISTAADELETAYNEAADGGKTKTAVMRSKEQELDKLMIQLTAYVQEASNGNELVILSSGLEVAAPKTPPQDLPAPQNLIAEMGTNEGEVYLRWKKVDKAKSYLLQSSADGATNWQTLNTVSTKSNAVIAGFTSGDKTWFRACAVGPKGNSPWSDPALGRAF
jgi:hypothetical protein